MKNQFSSVLKTFKGGVHPPDEKAITCEKPIQDFMDPQGDMIYPMQQHLGAPCKPVVKKGDHVLRDQIIGEPTGFLGAYIYTSVSGTVKDVKPMLHPNGTKVMSVIIENDHQYETKEKDIKPCSYKELTKEEILDRIKIAGIVGMGGAGFPTHIKLNPAPDKTIEYVIVNGSECEPYLTSDYRVMLEDPWRVINGLRIALSLFPGAKGRIGIEINKPKAIETLKTYIEDEQNIEIAALKTKYPQGGEKQLIYAITKREVPSGGLPADVGCIVLNVDTVVAISRAVTQARPLQRRIVTVVGDCVKTPGNFRVRIGTSFQEVVDAAGGLVKEPAKIICGGPMMGMPVSTLSIPVIKTSSCILLLSEEAAALEEESACIRCGKCIAACPIHLQPYELNQLVLRRDWDGFVKMHGTDCIECGSCSYACPAKRHLTQTCKLGRKTVADLKRQAAAKGGTRS